MPREFKNPLTQPSTSSATLPATETATSPDTFTYTSLKSAHRKRGAQAFEKTHERVTLWLDKSLKEQFEGLADEQGTAKSSLLDEAIADLLAKYHPPAPVEQTAPVEQKLPAPLIRETRKPVEVEAQPAAPGDLVSLQEFAILHAVNRNEAARLCGTGHITGIRQGNVRHMVISLAAKGRHDFWVQFRETPGFRACDDCPHGK